MTHDTKAATLADEAKRLADSYANASMAIFAIAKPEAERTELHATIDALRDLAIPAGEAVAEVTRGGSDKFGRATVLNRWLDGAMSLPDGAHLLYASPQPTPEASQDGGTHNAAERYKDWWGLQTRKGDPSHRVNLVRDAYGSGYDQGRLDERVRSKLTGRESTAAAWHDGDPWPAGYCLDPNGYMTVPIGGEPHWSFGYETGYAEAMAVKMRAVAALRESTAQAGAATESSSERSSGCLNSSGLAQTLTSETTSPSVLAMREALQAIINLADAGEDEAIGDIARAALAALPVPRAGERKVFLESLGLTDYLDFYIVKEREGDEHSAWLVVMPGGRTFAINGHADDAFDERLAGWIRDTLNAALAASPLATPTRPTLTERLQQKCSDWNTYWRSPDAHGVNLSVEEATELLADALGVEVAIATAEPQERKPIGDTAMVEVALNAARYVWLRKHALVGRGTVEFGDGFHQTTPEILDRQIDTFLIVPQDGDREEGEVDHG